MTKEKIREKHLFKNGLSVNKGDIGLRIQKAAFGAMDEFAKQTAIAFKEWQDENLEDKKWENYDGHDTWINPHTREVKSTIQLYELFLEQTK